jgi:DNA-binding XRE family transcriptional regulator
MSPAARRTRAEVLAGESRLRAASERIAPTRAFGARLRELRLAAGLTPAQLADSCRVSPSTISKAELGRGEPRLMLILVLCDGLRVSPDALIGALPVPQQRSMTIFERPVVAW